MLMYAIGGGSAGASVTLADQTVDNFRTPTAPCHAKFRISADGNFYKSSNIGIFGVSSGTWLTTGQSSSVWVERTMKSSSPVLDKDDISSSRVVCSSNLDFGYENSTSPTEETGTVTLDFYDAASGGTLLESADIHLVAEYDDSA